MGSKHVLGICYGMALAWLLAACAGSPEYSNGIAPSPAPASIEAEAADAAYGMPKLAARSEAAGAPATGAMEYALPKAPPSSSGLQAGFADDNAQFNYFVEFLERYGADAPHYPFDIRERLSVKIVDAAGKTVPNAALSVAWQGTVLERGTSYADGTFRLYPRALEAASGKTFGEGAVFDVRISSSAGSASIRVERNGPRQVEARLQKPRSIAQPVPLDLLFVLDTTGSMGGEIERLRATIEIIYANVSSLRPRPAVRLGMVLYKDRGDEYVTRIVPFTDDLKSFQEELDKVFASGGGDGPEDLQAALEAAVTMMDWNDGGIRLGFVITDAEAHLDYGQSYTYLHAARDAKAAGIKFYTIGTGGLPLAGEYLLRQLSQLTDARYIFLTYGERGESEGGAPGSVSHHTGANFSSEKLEAIVIRFVRDEVSFLSDKPPELAEDFFSAMKVDSETRDETLDKLFKEALGNLLDYSSYRITAATPMALVPIVSMGAGSSLNAEYFGERLSVAAATLDPKRFTLVERKDLQKLLEELELQLSGLVDEKSAARVGEFLGADVLIAGSLYAKDDGYELFIKLLRVSTAEVLAVTRAKIAPGLGL